METTQMNRSPEPSDDELARLSQAGDQDAFVLLLRRHGEGLRALIFRLSNSPDDAEDLLAETVMHAWVNLPALQKPDCVRAWLMQVARNRCRDHHKRQGRQPELLNDAELEFAANRFGRTAMHHRAAEVVEALGELPEALRGAADLHYLGGLTVAQVARQLGCPTGTVKRRLYEARRGIRHHLRPHSEEA
jgi:RNA polymerase sigma-70 factor, ECF subfamily